MIKLLIKNKIKIIIFIFILTLASIRCLNLDKDIPGWQISQFQPQDEYAYSVLSYNMYDHNKINTIGEFSQDQTQGLPQIKGTVFENFFTYISFLIFGKNYYGLRFFSALFGILSIMLIYLIFTNINKCDNDNKQNNYLLTVFLSIFMACDFTFLMTSRIAEPTIYREIIILFIFYLFTILKNKKYNYFLFGFMAAFSFLFVYFVNFFFFAASCVLVLISCLQKRIKVLIDFLMGILVFTILSEIYYHFVWNTTLLKTIKGIFFVFSQGRLTSEKVTFTNMIHKYIASSHKFFSANIFIYSPILLTLFLISLPSFLYKLIKEKNISDLFVFLIVLMMYLQTIFLDDYTARKLTTIYPFILYIIFIGIKSFYKFNNISIKRPIVKVLFTIYYLFSIIIASYISKIHEYNIALFSIRFKNILFYSNIIGELIILTIMLYILYCNIIKSKYIIFMLCFLLLIPNLLLSYKYIYSYKYYTEKNIMIELNKDIGSNYIINGYSYNLYNNIKPVLSYWDSYRGNTIYNNLYSKYVNNDKVKYLLTTEYTDDIPKELKLYSKKFKLIKTMSRSYTTDGEHNYVVLYEKVD